MIQNNEIKFWQPCEHETGNVYSKQWGFGTVVGKCGKRMQGIRVMTEDGKLIDMDYRHFHVRRKSLSYIEPWQNDRVTFLRKQGVKYLVHFTPASNLRSIMAEGIRPRTMQTHPGKYTDNDRLDAHQDASSFSVSFPNYQMFYRKRKIMNVDFAVLLIDIAVLDTIDPQNVGYYADNAARSDEAGSPFCQQCSLDAAKAMFEDTPERSRVKDCLPSCYTTHPQAELLVKGIIPPEYIRHVS